MMQYKGYIAKVEFDEDAKILHGEVAGIRDVVTFQADSVDKIEQAFRDSVDDYLAFCKEGGEQPDKPHSGQFVVRADSALHRDLAMLAQAYKKSLNALVVEFLSREVSQVLPNLQAQSPPHEMAAAAPDTKPRQVGKKFSPPPSRKPARRNMQLA